MTECCIDASIAVKWAVKKEPHRKKARAFLKDAGAKGMILIAPAIFISEADSAICKRIYDSKMTSDEARKAYAIWRRLL